MVVLNFFRQIDCIKRQYSTFNRLKRINSTLTRPGLCKKQSTYSRVNVKSIQLFSGRYTRRCRKNSCPFSGLHPMRRCVVADVADSTLSDICHHQASRQAAMVDAIANLNTYRVAVLVGCVPWAEALRSLTLSCNLMSCRRILDTSKQETGRLSLATSYRLSQ